MSGVILHNAVADFLAVDWARIKSESDAAAANELRAILSGLDGIEDKVFALRGMACLMIEERQLWVEHEDPEVGQPFTSFDRWLKWAAPKSWSYCRDAMRVVKELGADFPELLRIRRCNLEQLKKASTSVRRLPAVIEAAKTLPEKQFVETLNRDHNQHLEVKRPVEMAPAGDVAEFESAIAMAELIEEDCKSRADAIKVIAIRYLTDPGNVALWERRKAESA
jgi:hypothetical protein